MDTLVADRVHRLGTRWVNWYLIEDGDRLTVVDTGLPQYFDQLPAALAAIGRSLSDVEAVILTHSHFDVLGSAERIRTDSGGRAFIHPADAGIATMHTHARPRPATLVHAWRPGLIIFMAHLVSQGGMGLAPLTELTSLVDGDRLDVPGLPRVIASPGHTPGHCSLLLADRGVLFSGDALTTFDPAIRARGPRLPSTNTDRRTAFASLARLEETQAETVLPGRGVPWRGGVAEAVRRARDCAG